MTISSKLDSVGNIKSAIKQAIINKGVSVSSSDAFLSYSSKIESIQSLNGQTKTLTAGTLTPTTSTLTPDSGYNGLTSVTVDLSSYDTRLQALNGTEVSPVGSLSISNNGLYNCYGYQYVNVNVPNGSTGYSEFPNYQVVDGVATKRSGAVPLDAFSSIVEIASSVFSRMFTTSDLQGVISFPNLTTTNGSAFFQCFYNCSGITEVHFPVLTSWQSSDFYYAFYQCTSLRVADFSGLTTISPSGSSEPCERAFYGCTALTSVDFSSLKTMNRGFFYTFYGCSALPSIEFTSLDTVIGTYASAQLFQGAFYGCTSLGSVSFPALKSTSFGSYTNQLNGMFGSTVGTQSSTGTCIVHFPSNLQSTIAGLNGYPTFGGASGVIVLAFDLPATS